MPSKVSKRSRLRSRPLLMGLLVCVIATLVGFGLYRHYHHPNTPGSNTITSTAAPAADNSTSNARKGSSSPSATLDNGASSKPATTTASFSAQIVSANVSGGNLHVGTLVSGTTSGDCSLTATKPGQPTLQLGSSSVQQNVNNYDCGVFNIPTSRFPAGGSWQLLLTVTHNGASSTGSATVSI